MDHLVMTTQFGKFVFQGVEAMRAGRDNLFDAIAIPHLYVVRGLHLEKEFVPRAAGGITRACLLGPKDGEFNTHLIQNTYERLRTAFVAIVIRAGTSDPKQDLGAVSLCRQFGHRWYVHQQFFSALLILHLPRPIETVG